MSTPLTGPTFGSYAGDEVSWLLTDLSEVTLVANDGFRATFAAATLCNLVLVARSGAFFRPSAMSASWS